MNGFGVRPTASAYDENYAYDPNGNITTLQRNNELATLQDDFAYSYYDTTNRLKQHKVSGGLYTYDAIGNLTNDGNEGVTISWTPYGKVRTVQKGDSVTVNYRYDAAGNRIEKKVVKDSVATITQYLRDASGNVMAIYRDTTATEVPIYGSARLGEYKGGTTEGYRTLGLRNFELSNHLGNVLAVITDNAGMKADSVWAKVVSASDYYPFGLTMNGRTWSDTTSNYRYGFNGKEKDSSFASTTDYDYGFRIYSPEIAKFLSVDPLTKSYPMLTPYQFSGNSPIESVDLDGLERLRVGKSGALEVYFPNDATSQIHNPAPRIKIQPKQPEITIVNHAQVFIGPNPNSKETVSERKARINSITTVKAYEKFESEGQQRDPFVFGGPGNGEGFAKTFAEGVKEGSMLAVQELAVAKFSEFRHLGKFKEGASQLKSSLQLDAHASSSTFGKESLFVAPTSEIDELVSQGLSRKEIANKLGITDPRFLEGDLVKITISPEAIKNLRFPSGSETGANALFETGGKTSGGVTEAVIDPVKKTAKGVTTQVITK